MATTSSSTTKSKPESQHLTRSKSNIGRKPNLPSSMSSEEGSSDKKPGKPLPNYLKPTISSRPDLAKSVKKNNNSVEDNQKLLRRRSFDRPPSSLTSPSTSSPLQKSLNVSPSLPRDRPAVPREKPVTAQRSSSFHGSRGVPRGAASVKAPTVAPKKSGLSSSSSSFKGKKEGSNIKKTSEKEIPLDTASLSSAQEDEEEVIKVESDHAHVEVANVANIANDIEEPKDENETKEVQVEVVEAVETVEPGGEVESGVPTTVVSPLVGDCIVVVAKEYGKEEVIHEIKAEEKIEETKEQENNEDIKDDNEETINKKIDDEVETPEKVDTVKKEVESVEEATEEKVEEVKEDKDVKEENENVEEVKDEKEVQEVKEKEEVKEEKEKEKVKEEVKENEEVKEEKEKEKVTEEVKEKAKEDEKKKREVVKGKKESSSAYNDVIASKMQENPRKNKVLALAGAFQTVIDYETAASK